nr:23S rRNA (adenine(2030)-N(6))-methyltransferase RlmJ [Deltaproteobacteria bacterium]
ADLAIVDPPYVRREEWDEVPAAVAAAKARHPGLGVLLWYPIKAFTRPHQLQHAIRRAGLAATALDLVSTPVELRKNALAGSGLLLVDPPAGLVDALITAAAVLGPALATRPPSWELRATSWGAV